MNNNISENYQLNSILDIYNGRDNGNTTNNAFQYYIDHNSIPNGITVSDKLIPINGIHKISYANYYDKNNDFNTTYNYYPLLINIENNIATNNNYKLISFKDIDFENAYLKYANQKQPYNEGINYYELHINDDNQVVPEIQTTYTYVFGREISPYINNSYDLLNIVDYLLNRVNCLNFLLDIVKKQKNITH